MLSCGCALVLLSACTQAPLPPKEVLRRAVVAMQTLPSARFELSGSTVGGSGSLAFGLSDGIVQDRGRKISFTLEAHKDSASGFAMQVVAVDGCDIYVLPRRGDVPFARTQAGASGATLGSWQKFACGTASPGAGSTDADDVQRELQAMDMVEDLSPASIDGRPAYHFRVSVNAQRFLEVLSMAVPPRSAEEMQRTREFLDAYRITGELWMDRESFFLRRLAWDLTPVRGIGPAFRLEGRLWDQNAAPAVSVPQEASRADASALTGISTYLPLLLPLFGGSSS